MQIREAGPADAGALAAVHVASWRGAYRGLLPDEVLDALDAGRWQALWDRVLAEAAWPRRGTLLAQTPDGEVVGFADIRPTRDEAAGALPTGELTAIYVTPKHWDTGTGRDLMAAAVDRLRAAGFGAATLWVLSGNARAQRFYERAGWHADGTEKDAIVAGVPVTEVRYRRTL